MYLRTGFLFFLCSFLIRNEFLLRKESIPYKKGILICCGGFLFSYGRILFSCGRI